jgi:serine/threonine protein kinase
MEYVPGGLLKKLFKKSKPLNELDTKDVIKNILEGVSYIHERGFMHRDLKPENILLCDNSHHCLELKIVDFGLSVEHKNGPISL